MSKLLKELAGRLINAMERYQKESDMRYGDNPYHRSIDDRRGRYWGRVEGLKEAIDVVMQHERPELTAIERKTLIDGGIVIGEDE
ncbi:MAG: hypothetical protein JSV86_06065 [Gemmatimonadota bacterium]|nr:MAG: hypothetical protein JSV86_06065 [Gemmatimonadota bacterium]